MAARQFLLAIVAALLPRTALADEVDVCRAFALAEWRANDAEVRDIDLDRHVVEVERFDHQVGSQHVGSVATGVGILRRGADPDMVIRWLCLLESSDRALFVHLEPR